MLSDTQKEIIDDFANTYLIDFLTSLYQETLEKKVIIELLTYILTQTIEEETYQALRKSITNCSSPNKQATLSSGLQDIFHLYLGKFNQVKGNLGRYFIDYANDPRLFSEGTPPSSELLVQELKEATYRNLPIELQQAIDIESQRLAAPITHTDINFVGHGTYYQDLNLQKFKTHHTTLHQLYRDLVHYLQQRPLLNSIDDYKRIALFINQLNNFLALGADACYKDSLNYQPLDYLLTPLPPASLLPQEILKTILPRILKLYQHFNITISSSQKVKLAQINLPPLKTISYETALLPEAPILPTDDMLKIILREAIKQNYQSPYVASLSRNDHNHMDWLVEHYLSQAIPDWDMLVQLIASEKETFIRTLSTENYTTRVTQWLTPILERMRNYSKITFAQYLEDAKSQLYVFHQSITSQGIISASGLILSIITPKLGKISASQRTFEILNRAADQYTDLELKKWYLRYLSSLQTATDPKIALQSFFTNLDLLLHHYIFEPSQKPVERIISTICGLLKTKLSPYVWFWTLPSPIIYPITGYESISHFLTIKKILENHKELNQEKENTKFYLRYQFSVSNDLHKTFYILLDENKLILKSKSFVQHFYDALQIYDKEIIFQLCQCLLHKKTYCKLLPETKVLIKIAKIIHSIYLTLNENDVIFDKHIENAEKILHELFHGKFSEYKNLEEEFNLALKEISLSLKPKSPKIILSPPFSISISKPK